MIDIVDPEKRSLMMSGIRSKHTKPERLVRSMLHAAGFRYRLHRQDIPGVPDLILPKHGAAIFVHGCFWHMHANCRFATTPSSNRDFWQKKLARNRERDQRQLEALKALGWRVLIVWECATRIGDLRSNLQADMVDWLLRDSLFAQIPAQAPSRSNQA
ncbi:DNA mismatch endonuclease Vsr [Caballeronia pedi]|uniref:DNA mismatch endonuclease Vsr n=1 Tax=Caballeronia pedi TaxID=1777141 RepID=A0A158A3J4_9BURK|nr:very short patch repair endonuclease [Caballeronia pedi]SAK51667.1 DNA mismatch endonuclease Vsr [Caballeronia pedi]